MHVLYLWIIHCRQETVYTGTVIFEEMLTARTYTLDISGCGSADERFMKPWANYKGSQISDCISYTIIVVKHLRYCAYYVCLHYQESATCMYLNY